MKIKINGTNVLIGLLFTLVSMLIAAVGLKLSLDGGVYNLIFTIGIFAFFVSLLFLFVGSLFPSIYKPQKVKP